jgi:ABC-type bacteriocin/lantibiotic exporter with double-glycine peptidase domain
VWRGLLRRIEGARLALVALTAAAVFAALPVAVAAILSRVFVDEVLVAGRTDWLPGLVAAAALAFLAHLAATATLETVLRRLEARLALGGASSLLWHVLRLPFAFFTQRAPEDVVDRLRSNDDAARTIVRTVGLTLARLAGAVLFVLLIAVLDVWIALVTVAFAALSIAVTVHAQRRLRDASAALKVHEAKVFADTAMAISAAETIKATGTQEATFVRWAGHHATALNVEQDLGRLGAVLRALPPLTDSVSVALVLVLGALAVMAGDMTLGTLVAVVALLAAVREPVQALATMLAEIESVRAAFQRIDDVHNYDLDQTFAGDAPPPAAITGRARLAGRIELKDVTFGYSPLAPPLVKDFSLSIPPGGRVALVGGTGSGKSTIAKLVAGLYRPWSGAILLDGREPAEIPRWFLKTSIGWVDQDLTLFEGSVRDNLTLWDNSIPEATLARAARDAAIYETISARPGGFEHRVLEGGANFSGGQAQRLQIARAFALDPSIVVFDEATSALDPALEREIDLSLRRRGCTALIVAHRLSTIRDCDEIVVMDRGAIVERGTHEELMEKGGHYRSLIHA